MTNHYIPKEDEDIFVLEMSSYSSTDTLDLVNETSTDNILSPKYWTAGSVYAGSELPAQPGAAAVHEPITTCAQTFQNVDLEDGRGIPPPIVPVGRHKKTVMKRKGTFCHRLKYVCIGLVILCGILGFMVFLGWLAKWATDRNADGTHPYNAGPW